MISFQSCLCSSAPVKQLHHSIPNAGGVIIVSQLLNIKKNCACLAHSLKGEIIPPTTRREESQRKPLEIRTSSFKYLPGPPHVVTSSKRLVFCPST